MRIAVSSTGKTLDDEVSPVFGRCPYFLIIELTNKEPKLLEAVANTSADQRGGAGISAARLVAGKKVDAVVSGNIGPRALDVLGQFNVKVFKKQGIVREVLNNL
jgi:predicted Fe-Mo cluster-binding NifX family protein